MRQSAAFDPSSVHAGISSCVRHKSCGSAACPRWHPYGEPARPRRLHRDASPLPQRILQTAALKYATKPVGARLARDGIHTVSLPDRAACIASKPAPTWILQTADLKYATKPVGAWLARDGIHTVSLPDRAACIAMQARSHTIPCARPLHPQPIRQRQRHKRHIGHQHQERQHHQ